MWSWRVISGVDMGPGIRATRAEIDLDAVCQNARALRDIAGTRLAAVVKADAYGHGAVPVARALEADGCAEMLAVSLVEEGIELREAGLAMPILVMGPAMRGGYDALVDHDLTPVVSCAADLAGLAEIGTRRGQPVPVHLKLDTGMGRLGLPDRAIADRIRDIHERGGLRIAGLCTHFASADLDDTAAAEAVTRAQLARFENALSEARTAGLSALCVHASNSAATIRYPRARFDMVRPGLALYGNGLGPDPERGRLRQAMRLVTEIAQLRPVDVGQAVSYGGVWQASRPSNIAVLAIGYADGYPRSLTGRAEVLIRGRRCPVVGAISMDMTLVDVTSLGHDVRVGEEVILLGQQGDDCITTAEFAAGSGLTQYEVTCGVSKRVPRMYP